MPCCRQESRGERLVSYMLCIGVIIGAMLAGGESTNPGPGLHMEMNFIGVGIFLACVVPLIRKG